MNITSFWLGVGLLFWSLQGHAEVSGDWEYSVSGGEVVITNYTGLGGVVQIPETLAGLPVKEIGALALSGKGITGLTIPNTIIRLGDNAFSANPGLSHVSISSNITNLPTGVFASSGLSSFLIPTSVVKIGAGAFYECTNLTGITIPGSVIEIEPYAFLDCRGLTNVVFEGQPYPNPYPKVGNSSFQGTPYGDLNPILDGLGYVSLDGQTNGPLAAVFNFQGEGETNVIVPAEVYGREVTTLATRIYWYGDLLRFDTQVLTLPSSVTNIALNSLSCRSSEGGRIFRLARIEVSEGNPAYRAADGVLYGKDRPRLIHYPPFKTNLTHYSIAAGTESVEPEAFRNTTLSSVEIPNSVTSIGESAFRDSRLTNLTVPNSVTNLAWYAFFGSSLKNVVLGSGLTTIKHSVFEYCGDLTNVSLPPNLTRIDSFAFGSCGKLEQIILPESMVEGWSNTNPLAFTAFGGTPIKKAGIPYALLVHPGAMASLTNNFPQVLLSSATQTRDLYVNSIASALVGVLATNQVFISNLAQAILAASNNYGLATKTEVGGAVTLGVQQVLSAPSDYNLFTPLQVQSERTAAQSEVLNDPNSYSLYTTNQIQNLGMGGIVLNRNTNNQLVLNYEILQSSDLQNWAPYQQNELVISNAPADKMFLRVQAVGQ